MFSLSILRFFSYMLKDASGGTIQEHWCRTLSQKAQQGTKTDKKVTWKMQCYQRKPACCTHLQLNQTFLIQTCHKQPVNQAKSWQIDYSGMQQVDSIILTTSLAKWTKLHLSFECLYLNYTVVITCPRIPNCVETWSALAPHTPFHQHAFIICNTSKKSLKVLEKIKTRGWHAWAGEGWKCGSTGERTFPPADEV